MKYSACHALAFLLCVICKTTTAQPKGINLRGAGNVFISTHETITDAYAAIPATLTQPYVIEVDSNYNPLAEVFPITFTEKAGASAVNTITVRLAPYEGGGGIISSDTTNPIIIFDNADWIIIDGITGPSNMGFGIMYDNSLGPVAHPSIRFINGASHNTIEQVGLFGTFGFRYPAPIIEFSTSVSNAEGNSDNTVRLCYFNDNLYGILSSGTIANPNRNNHVLNCEFENYIGIQVEKGTANMLIEKNWIKVSGRADTTSCSGIVLKSISDTVTINRNNIVVSAYQATPARSLHGIKMLDAMDASYALVTNNLVYIGGNTHITDTAIHPVPDSISLVSGITLSNGAGLNAGIYHNTIRLEGARKGGAGNTIGSAAIYKTGNATDADIDIRNNILQNNRTGDNPSVHHPALAFTDATGNFTLEYNVYNAATGELSSYLGAISLTIPAHRAAVGNGQEMFSNDLPVTYIDGSYRLSAWLINHPDIKGAVLPDIPLDYENDTRSYYYRGADELLVNCSGTPPNNNDKGYRVEICGKDSVLAHTSYSVGNNENLGGRVFQWQSRPLGGTQPFTDIPGAGSNAYSTLIKSSVIFRIKDSCADGSAPRYSEPDTFVYKPHPTVDSITATHLGLTYTFAAVDAKDVLDYKWRFGDGDSSSLPNPVHTYADNKEYFVSLTVTNTCGSHYVYSYNHRSTSIAQPFAAGDIHIYPNPAGDELLITLPGGQSAQPVLYSYMGVQVPCSYSIQGSIISVNTSSVPSGSYILKLANGKGVVARPVQVLH